MNSTEAAEGAVNAAELAELFPAAPAAAAADDDPDPAAAAVAVGRRLAPFAAPLQTPSSVFMLSGEREEIFEASKRPLGVAGIVRGVGAPCKRDGGPPLLLCCC